MPHWFAGFALPVSGWTCHRLLPRLFRVLPRAPPLYHRKQRFTLPATPFCFPRLAVTCHAPLPLTYVSTPYAFGLFVCSYERRRSVPDYLPYHYRFLSCCACRHLPIVPMACHSRTCLPAGPVLPPRYACACCGFCCADGLPGFNAHYAAYLPSPPLPRACLPPGSGLELLDSVTPAVLLPCFGFITARAARALRALFAFCAFWWAHALRHAWAWAGIGSFIYVKTNKDNLMPSSMGHK